MDIITGEQESETVRLTRCLAALGEFDLDNRTAWDLHLQQDEIGTAMRVLAPLAGRRFIAINLGGKVAVKDWGEDNWRALLQLMSANYRNLGLVFFGSSDEWERCERVGAVWPGPMLNLCGALTPRQAAAALSLARAFLGHDSGPMHLAAAVKTSCVCMFGGYNAPKRWHPYGVGHQVIHNMDGITRIAPSTVYAALQKVLNNESKLEPLTVATSS